MNEDHKFGLEVLAPNERARDCGGGAAAVHAEGEELDAAGEEGRDDGAGGAGDVALGG